MTCGAGQLRPVEPSPLQFVLLPVLLWCLQQFLVRVSRRCETQAEVWVMLDEVDELFTLTIVPVLVFMRYSSCYDQLFQKTVFVLADLGRTVNSVDKVLHNSRSESASHKKLFDYLCVCRLDEGRILQQFAELDRLQVESHRLHIAGIVVVRHIRLVLGIGDA
jgi:hypothetical protein